MTMTQMSESTARTWRSRSTPSTPGMRTSSSTIWWRPWRISISASAGFEIVVTLKPSRVKNSRR